MTADESPKTEDTADLIQDHIPTEGADLEDSGPDLPPQIGHFRILRKIGEGGMGVVYEAEQDRPRRRVALKAIRPESTTAEIIKRFEQELEVLGRLHHPGVAEIYEAGTVDTAQGARPYFAMEYIDGENLTAYSKAHNLTTRQRLALLAKICDAIQHAHQRGVIHRDLKPGNILVVDTETSIDGDRPGSSTSIDTDDVGQPKVLDFGVARATGLDLQVTLQTNLGQIIGTVPYMSPEQISGDPEQVDTRSDVYAVGVIAYELLTGHLPYEVWGKPIQEAARIISEEEPSRLQTVNRQYRGDIDTIVRKALEKDRERRYQSAEEMAADIRRFLSEQPILARPPSTAYQLKKFARRNKGLVAGITAAFLFLFAGVIASTWQAVRVVRERDRANIEAATAREVSDFLIGLFEESDPWKARGEEITARQILDLGVDRIQEDLTDEPLTQARLMATMGKVYSALGLYEAARPLLEGSLSVLEKELPPDDSDLAASIGQLAYLETKTGHYDHARSLYERELSIRESVLGDAHPTVAETLTDLGHLEWRTGHWDLARHLHERALAIREERLGPDDPAVAESLRNLGIVSSDEGNDEQALEFYQRALGIIENTRGPDDRRAAEILNSMALSLDNLEQNERALELLDRSLDIRLSALEPDHPDVAFSLHNKGRILAEMGDYEAARGLYEQAIEIRRRALGPNHEQVGMAIESLAILAATSGDLAGAEPLFEEALRINEVALGPAHVETLESLQNLAMLTAYRGRDERALTLLETATDRGYDNVKILLEDESFVPIRSNPRFVGIVDAARRNAENRALLPDEEE